MNKDTEIQIISITFQFYKFSFSLVLIKTIPRGDAGGLSRNNILRITSVS